MFFGLYGDFVHCRLIEVADCIVCVFYWVSADSCFNFSMRIYIYFLDVDHLQ